MACIVFLGFIILGYFVYQKFLRRLFTRFWECHHSAEEGARENGLSPATTISTGRGEMWEFEFRDNRFNGISDSYVVPNPSENNSIEGADVHQNNRRQSNPILDPPYLNDDYEKNFVDEEEDLRKKEQLYLKALNRGRPRGHPKIHRIPDVGYLPTIFEKMPYPVTREALMSCIEEETVRMRSAEQSCDKLPKRKAGKESVRVPLEEHKAEEEPVDVHLTANEADGTQIRTQPPENVAEEKKMPVKKAAEKSVGKQLTEKIEEPAITQLRSAAENPANGASEVSKKKKKGFRRLRKFFSRFSCIPKVKD